MTIHLPDDLEPFIRAEVQSGHFSTESDAVAEAVRLLRSQFPQAAAPARGNTAAASDPVLGALRDAADELDEIVAASMGRRETRP